uniref:Transcription initiation factor IIE subunit beta n=2 Tax=Timema TaxID=61471 RepID=A0A7R9D6X3_TIMCR|nr:unnamed protein product [Timema cristinae]
MDPALLRERELFKMRAMSTPTVEKKKKDPDTAPSSRDDSKKKTKPLSYSSSGPKMDSVNYKTMTGSSNYKFGVLAKIVKHMRSRHQEGDDHPLSVEEILDETNQLDASSKIKHWRDAALGLALAVVRVLFMWPDVLLFEVPSLVGEIGGARCGNSPPTPPYGSVHHDLPMIGSLVYCKSDALDYEDIKWLLSEALTNNPKIEVTLDGKFLFKPSYRIRDRKNLLKLLKQHDLKGLGGILLEDIQESLPHCEKALKILQDEIIYIIRPIDKKKIVFYNDKTATLPIDEEFQKLWRSAAVESVDDQKIEEYLEKQGIRSMQDHGLKKPLPQKRKKPNQRKKQNKKPRDNEHLAHVLENYEDK